MCGSIGSLSDQRYFHLIKLKLLLSATAHLIVPVITIVCTILLTCKLGNVTSHLNYC